MRTSFYRRLSGGGRPTALSALTIAAAGAASLPAAARRHRP
jgi:hypothetical protein